MYSFSYDSPIGVLYLTFINHVLISVSVNKPNGQILKKCPYKPVINYFDNYFSGKCPEVDFPIKLTGTNFQISVFKELLKIPYGKSTSYKQIAEKVFKDKPCAQAVGGAVGKNPLLIIVPCHRVLGSDKSLIGFSAGIDKKIWLLKHEDISFKK